MRKAIACLFIFPLMLFGDVQFTYEDAISNFSFDSFKREKIKEVWLELNMPTIGENKRDFQTGVAAWFANKENQAKFIQKLRDQAKEGGLESSEEVSRMISEIESALDLWHKTYKLGQGTPKVKSASNSLCIYSCRIKGYKREEVNETNAAKRIEELREEEEKHKDKALDYIIASGKESIYAGVSYATGVEVIGVIETIEASRDFVKACKEYNEGVRCQHEAEELERKYFKNEDEEVKKNFWEFWK